MCHVVVQSHTASHASASFLHCHLFEAVCHRQTGSHKMLTQHSPFQLFGIQDSHFVFRAASVAIGLALIFKK